jgi:translocation protein SEC62
LFGFVWAITAGKHHFWLLPNLTEDCGFFESFVPLYSHSPAGNKENDNDGDNGTSEDKQGTSEDKQEQGQGNEDEKSKDNEGEEDKGKEDKDSEG